MKLPTQLVLFIFPVVSLGFEYSGPYCGNGANPNTGSCTAGLALINPGTEYATNQLIMSGDCSIRAGALSLKNHFTGQEWIDSIEAIVNTRCGAGNGWHIGPSGANFSIYQCRTGGGFGVPDQPCRATPQFVNQAKRAVIPLEAPSAADLSPARRTNTGINPESPRSGTQLARSKLKERQNPDEGYICQGQGGLGVLSSSCNAIGNALRGKTWLTPFTMGDNDGCSMAFEIKVMFFGQTVDGDEVADHIDAGVSHCNGGGRLGMVTYNPPPNLAYTLFFGLTCSAFGFGNSECGNSGGQ